MPRKIVGRKVFVAKIVRNKLEPTAESPFSNANPVPALRKSIRASRDPRGRTGLPRCGTNRAVPPDVHARASDRVEFRKPPLIGCTAVLALLAIAWAKPAGAAIEVCGSIGTDTIWSPGDVRVITCEVIVEDGVTLTILPGTVVKASYGTTTPRGLTVRGHLDAQGTGAAPIVFTSLKDDTHGSDTNGDGAASAPAAGDWQSITFAAGSTGQISDALIAYGGSWYYHYDSQANVRCFDAAVNFDRVALRSSSYSGLYAERCATSFTNGSVADNALFGLRYEDLMPAVPLVIENNDLGPGASSRLAFGAAAPGAVTVRDNRSVDGGPGFAVVGTLNGSMSWDNPDLVLLTGSGLVVEPDATLQLAPGTVVKSINYQFGPGGIEVRGSLAAEGSAAAPIAFTSIQDDEYGGDTNGDGASDGTPGQWAAITFAAGSSGRISHAVVANGGAYYYHYGTQALLRCHDCDLSLENVTLRNSGYRAIFAENGSISAAASRIHDNAIGGIFNNTPAVVVDARFNWWGDPSGPQHGAKNPTGLGDSVSDGVLFFPWAVDAEGTVPSSVHIEGPTWLSPGDTATYAVSYYAGVDLDDAILLVALPPAADYVQGSDGAVSWAERHEVFWQLGSLAAGGEGTLAFQLRYAWGLPSGLLAHIAGLLLAEGFPGPLETTPYFAYRAATVASSTPLLAADVEAERAQYPDLDQLYRDLLDAGYILVGAIRQTLDAGEPVTQLVLINQGKNGFAFVNRQGAEVVATVFSPATFELRAPEYSAIYDTGTQMITTTSQASPATALLHGPGATVGACMDNCLYKNFVNFLSRKKLKLSDLPACKRWLWDGVAKDASNCLRSLTAVPLSITALDYWACRGECSFDPSSHYCSRDDARCLPDIGLGAGAWIQMCDPLTGRLGAPRFERCARSEPCIETLGCYSRAKAAGGTAAEYSSTIRVPKDPNAKYGPAGDVVPTQAIEYEVEYENVGAGRAFGVYITDRLAPQFDASTLDLRGLGEFFPTTRTILWEIGELAPKGDPGSMGMVSFEVELQEGLASGTVLTNQATVFFPSVPEETATNTVVNVVQPLAAVPQSLQTEYATPIAITLSGIDAGAAPLAFAVRADPLDGELTGAPPTLTYTPAANFTGRDWFTFVADNGVMESAPAVVTILVSPSDADTIPPAVLWTYPAPGAVLDDVPLAPIVGEGVDPIYAPSVLVGFSEAMDGATIDGSSVTVRDYDGRIVDAAVSWDGTVNQAALTPHEPWQDGSYTATVATAATDASGNPLSEAYSWSFRIGAALCAGDCNADGRVAINELIRGVNIALGRAAIAECPSFDANLDGRVTIGELIRAVNNALNGCDVAAATATRAQPR
jgi:hypothetical protein